MSLAEECLAKASISITGRANFVNILWKSLKPEVERPSSSRSRIFLVLQEETIRIMISASDVTALRSALNSYLRWVKSITDVLDKASNC